MMAASPLFSATITTGHPRQTHIGAPSEHSLHSVTTKPTCILIIVITNQHSTLHSPTLSGWTPVSLVKVRWSPVKVQ